MSQPNLKIEIIGGYVALIVEDTEVFDYVEDLLSEKHDLDYAYFGTSETNGVKTYTLHFPNTSDPTELQAAIDTMDRDELKRIWCLNN